MTTFIHAVAKDFLCRRRVVPVGAGFMCCRAAAARGHVLAQAIAFLVVLAIPLTAGAQPSATPTPLRPGDVVTIVGAPGPMFGGAAPPYRLVAGPTTLSNFSDPSQGPTAVGFGSLGDASLAIEDASAVFTLLKLFGTNDRGALVRVDAATGMRAIISDFGDASQGPLGGKGLAIERSGDFLVVGLDGTALVRVNRSDGARVIVSDFSDPAQGPVFGSASGVTVEESGDIVVGGPGGLFQVDRFSGVRTLLSDFASPTQGPSPRSGSAVVDLAVDFAGNIIALTDSTQFFSVDPAGGIRRLVFEQRFPSPSQQCLPTTPVERTFELAIDEAGDIRFWALSFFGFELRQGLGRVDPVTGTCVAGLGIGPFGGVAVVPTPLVNELVSVSVVSTALAPSIGNPSAPAGVFRIAANLTNVTSTPIRTPFFRVAEISGGNLLVNADKPPVVPELSGKGARLTPDVGIDGVLAPGESIEVVFDIGLQARQPFTFFVNVFGERDAEDGAR